MKENDGLLTVKPDELSKPRQRACQKCATFFRQEARRANSQITQEELRAIIGPPGYVTDWVPPDGVDPRLWEFRCGFGHIFYVSGPLRENVDAEQSLMFDVDQYDAKKQARRQDNG